MKIQGKTVAVVAPGGGVQREKLEPGLTFLRGLGATPILGLHVYDRHRYLAGTRWSRFKDLEWALTAPEIDLVWLVRGGYGTAQLLDLIPWNRVVRDRKVIGFSDATALLLALAQHGMDSIHGPVLTSFAHTNEPLDAASVTAITELLSIDKTTFLSGTHLCGAKEEVSGVLLGGNLTVLASLAGTKHALFGHDALLLLEDVGESPYRIERLLCQLIESGGFAGVKGVGLGEFVRCHPASDADYRLLDIFIEHLEGFGFPVLHQLPVGHGVRNVAFRYGTQATLTTTGIQASIFSVASAVHRA